MPGLAGSADFLILGGGIAGISAAARLAPDASVIVLEAEAAIGSHATGRSAAMFIAHYGPPVAMALARLAGPELHDHEALSPTPLLHRRGDMTVARADDAELVEDMLARGDGLERLTSKEAQALVPVLREQACALVALEPGASDIDVAALLQGFARQLKSHGGSIITNARAEAISRDGEGWRVTTGQGEFAGKVIVNAAGAWADHVAALAGVRPIGIQPKRRSAALVVLPEGLDASAWPMVGDAADRWYCRPDSGRLMVSPADEDPIEAQDAWPDDLVLAEGIHRFEQAMDIPVTRIEHRWAGLRSFAPDGNMVVGFDPASDGFFWLAGQGGYGIETSPAVSRLAASLCLGQVPEAPSDLVAALNPARFNENDRTIT